MTPASIIAHLEKDPRLALLIEKVPFPAHKTEAGDLYVSLLESITSQQLSTKAAATIWARVLSLFPDEYPHAAQLIALPADVLRSKGLSYGKAAYMQNVARFHLEHDLYSEHIAAMPDDELVAYLTQIKGVGRWTVEMILMFSLNRADVFAPDDQGITSAMVHLYQIEETKKAQKKRMLAIAESWRPYRTTACRYLWRWRDAGLMKELVHGASEDAIAIS